MIILRFFTFSLFLVAILALNVALAQETGSASHEDQLEEEGNVEGEGVEHAGKVPPAAAAADTAGSAEPGVASDTPVADAQAREFLEELKDLPKENATQRLYKLFEEELAKLQQGPSEHIQLSHLFLYPSVAGQVGRTLDLPTGKTVRVALHMHNKGDSAFHVDMATAAFRYPMDMTYIIQNFTNARYHGQDVEPGREASFLYQFYTDPQLAARSFGLTVQLGYRDAEGKAYLHTAINQTVSLYEPDEGFDGETFFMYIFLAVLSLLGAAGLWYLLKTYTPAKKLAAKAVKSKQPSAAAAAAAAAAADAASTNNGGHSPSSANYNLEWIPQQHLDIKNRRAKLQQQQSPRQRKSPTKQQQASDASD